MNQELERTEELMAPAGQKGKRKKLIVIVVAAAVLAVGVGVFTGIKMHSVQQVKDQLKIADAKLKEGKYEDAIAAYDKVINMDDKNAAAYEGRGDAYSGIGEDKKALADYEDAIKYDKNEKTPYDKAIRAAVAINDMEKAEQLTEQKRANVDGTENDTVESVMIGGEPGNLANKGLVLQDGKTRYVANMNGKGSIGVINDDKKQEPIVKNLKDDGKDVFISGLNIWNGYLYFMSSSETGEPDNSCYYGKSIYRIKADGTGSEEKIFSVDWNDYSSESGTEPPHLSSTMIIAANRLFFGQLSAEEAEEVDWQYNLCSVDLYGNDLKSTGEKVDDVFTSDGKKIFYIRDNERIEQFEIGSGKVNDLVRENAQRVIGNTDGQIVYFDGALYYLCDSGMEYGNGVWSYNLQTKEERQEYEGECNSEISMGADGELIPSGWINVIKEKLILTKSTKGSHPDIGKLTVNIAGTDLNKEEEMNNRIAVIMHDFSKEGITYDIANDYCYTSYEVNGISLCDNKIYYSIEGYYQDVSCEKGRYIFGETELNGSSIKEY